MILRYFGQAELQPQHVIVYPTILGYFCQYLIIYWLKNRFSHVVAVLDCDSHSHAGSTNGQQHLLFISKLPFSSKHAMHCFRKLKQYSSIDPREIFPAGYSIYQTFCILFRNNANVIELILLTDRKLQKKVLSKE